MTKLTKYRATWTHDKEAGAYYFAPEPRPEGPYTCQREVPAIIDIAPNGTLAGVELVLGNLPPPPWLRGLAEEAAPETAAVAQQENGKTMKYTITIDFADVQAYARAYEAIKVLMDVQGGKGTLSAKAWVEAPPTEPPPPPTRAPCQQRAKALLHIAAEQWEDDAASWQRLEHEVAAAVAEVERRCAEAEDAVAEVHAFLQTRGLIEVGAGSRWARILARQVQRKALDK